MSHDPLAESVRELTAALTHIDNTAVPNNLLSKLTKAVLKLEPFENIPAIFEVQEDLLDIIIELREQRPPRSNVKLVDTGAGHRPRRRQPK